MVRSVAVIVLLVLLAGCATGRYYPVQIESGGYYIAEREHAVSGHDSLGAFGMYPWWVHSFYTPYFFPYSFSYYHPFYYPYSGPYAFAGWYPSWPWYAGLSGSYGIGQPSYGSHYRHPAGQGAVAGRQRPERFGARAAMREDSYRRPSLQQPGGLSPGPQRVTAPVDAARRSQGTAPLPFGSEPGRMQRVPAERSRSERHE